MTIDETFVSFEALTPLWTGNALGRSDRRILETGILGSLRWWTELLARGAGCNVPDPTKQTPMQECPVAEIFGHTGQQRKFRLLVEEKSVVCEEIVPGNKVMIPTDTQRHAPGCRPKHSCWYYPSGARKGRFELRFIPSDRQSARFSVDVICGVLRFIECCGALGAKTQLGLGLIRINHQIDVEPLLAWLDANRQTPQADYMQLPSLRNYFHATVTAPTGDVKDSFLLKYRLRCAFPDCDIRHKLFGVVDRNEPRGSRISVSLPFNGQIRVFGWIPEDTRRSHLDVIESVLQVPVTDCGTWFASDDFISKLSSVLSASPSQ
jgi:CRISPR-associated protein Cmr1